MAPPLLLRLLSLPAVLLGPFKGPYAYPEPPDGGFGWAVSLGAFLIYCTTVGIQYTVGLVYRALLVDVEFTRGWDRSQLAWVVSIESCCFLGGQLFAGHIVNGLGVRVAVLVGLAFLLTGFFLSSVASSPGVLYLTYGVLTGTGCSLPSAASIVLVTRYFRRRRVTATGFAVCGSGAGALILGPVVEWFIGHGGWRDACVFLGILNGVVLPLSCFLMVPIEITEAAKGGVVPQVAAIEGQGGLGAPVPEGGEGAPQPQPHPPPPAASSAVEDWAAVAVPLPQIPPPPPAASSAVEDWAPPPSPSPSPAVIDVVVPPAPSSSLSAIRRSASTIRRLSTREMLEHRPFLVWILFVAVYGATWFVIIGHFITSVQESGTSPAQSSLLVLTQGIANTVGRAGLGVFADRVSWPKLRILQACVALVGLFTAGLSVFGDSFAYQVVYMLVNGGCGGSIVSVQAPITVDLVGLASLPVAQGLFHMAQAPFVLVSPPIAGAVRAATSDYRAVWMITGVFMVASSFACSYIVSAGPPESAFVEGGKGEGAGVEGGPAKGGKGATVWGRTKAAVLGRSFDELRG
jgi:MFS family permease